MTSSSIAEAPAPISRSGFGALVAITALDAVGLGILLPLLPFLIMEFGGRPMVVTQLVALYSLAGIVSSPLVGRWSDRFGRGLVLKVTLVGSLIAYVGMLATWSLVGVFLFRVLSGFLTGRGGLLRALATDGVDPDVQVSRIAWLSAMTAIGTSLGPLLASLVAYTAGDGADQYRLTLLTGAALSVVTLLATIICVRAGGERQKAAAGNGPGGGWGAAVQLAVLLRRPLALSAMVSFGQGVTLSVTALYVAHRFFWGTKETAWLLAAMTAAMAFTRIVVFPRLLRRFGGKRVLIGLLACTIPSLAGAGISATVGPFVLLTLVFSVAIGMAGVIPTTMVSSMAPVEHRGVSFGLNQSAVGAGMFLSAGGNGVWFEAFGPSTPFFLGSLVLAIALSVAVRPLGVSSRNAT